MLYDVLHYVFAGVVVLFLFNLTIFIHELGHFLVGRWRGAKIERFAIWFGPAIWSRMINGVEFRLGCIPLGGYVAFPQLAMEAVEGKSETPAGEIKPLQPRDKIPILVAGSLFNVLLGIAFATLVYGVGVPKDPSVLDLRIGSLPETSNEWKEGIRPGDKIVSVNGRVVHDHEEIVEWVALSSAEKVTLEVLRDGQPRVFRVEPTRNPDDLFKIRRLQIEPPSGIPVVGKVMRNSPAERAGLLPGDKIEAIEGVLVQGRDHMSELISKRGNLETRLRILRKGERLDVTLIPKKEANQGKVLIGIYFGSESVYPTPWRQIKRSVISMLNTFNALLHSKTTGVSIKDLSGPVGITQHLFEGTMLDLRIALAFMVLLNINLAIINLLPIPVLDGGHIVFTMVEAIRRKPLNTRFVEATQMVFVVLLLSLMLYITFNDIARWTKISEAVGRLREKQPPVKEFREEHRPATP